MLTADQLAGINVPLLLTAAEVCQLARYSRAKLAAEVDAGRMPQPVSRGRQHVFKRDAVFIALGITSDAADSHPDPWL